MTILSKKGFKVALATVAAGILPASAHAATLAPNDYVGISFWLISMALIAATAFFFMENITNSIRFGYVSSCSALLLHA